MHNKNLARSGIIIGAITGVSLLHYQTATTHMWLHQLFQRGYYVPVLLASLWFGWRGGLLAATLAGGIYAPHILMAWRSSPTYTATQYAEIVMFFVVGALVGILADQERAQRARLQETLQQLSKVYEELQQSFDQVRRADRLSALGELAAGLAHEIRNPLGSIEGAMRILTRNELAGGTRTEFAELAQKEIDRLKGLVSNFLDFARPHPPRRNPTELSSLLESVRLLADEAGKMAGVEIRVEPGKLLPTVPVDADQIKQVMLNLVLNAIQSMSNGGEIVLLAEQKNDSVEIRVKDQGVGVEPENLERVFDPFFTTRAGGTGLGLSVAYKIVQQHGGHIAATPNPDRGMTFAIMLPLKEELETAEVVTPNRGKA